MTKTMTHPSSPRPLGRCTALALSAALALTACKTAPGGAGGETNSYVQSCLTGALALGALDALYLAAKGKKDGKSAGQAIKERSGHLMKAAAGGCAIGLAVTAVGKLMDDQQRARHEEAMQRDARRRALEQQQYAGTEKRLQAAPAATPAQRTARDAQLEKARSDWEANYSKPSTYDLGNGGSTTVQAEPPRDPAATGQCVDYSVSVRTGAGTARQFETWCPDASGKMVRLEVRDKAAA